MANGHDAKDQAADTNQGDVHASAKGDPLHDPACQVRPWQRWKEKFFANERELECVQVEVTSACPCRCTYCPHTTDKEHWKSRHMDEETFACLWPLLRQSKRAHLQGWGEPLLHPHFFDFVEFARRAGCAVSTTTSGICMTDEIAENLVDSGVDVVAFSLIGTDTASNARREGISFERATDAIRTLQRARKTKNATHMELHIAYLMLADDVDAVRNLPQLMEELDVDGAIISTMDYISDSSMASLAFEPPSTPKAEARIAAARKVLRSAREEAHALGRELFFTLPGKVAAPQCRENTQRTVYIDAEGNMASCTFLNMPNDDPHDQYCVFGNVRERDALEIWRDPAFKAFRKSILTNDPPKACIHCPKRFEIVN